MVGLVKSDAYEGRRDLRAMQELACRLLPLGGRFHVGDLAWQSNLIGNQDGCGAIRLWRRDKLLRAWGWLHAPAQLDLAVDPECSDLVDVVLDWFEGEARGESFCVNVLETEVHLISSLKARGYRAEGDAPFNLHAYRSLHDLPPPTLPQGFRALSMCELDDVAGRAAAHKMAWPNREFARVTTRSYSQVMATWPYRPELDWVIEAPDGRLAACVNVWPDEVNRIGEIEPVGTDPAFRRRGLARAVCLYALHALAKFGMEQAIVYPRGDSGHPIPRALYEGMGFQAYARTVHFVRGRHG